jgi:hypothetical protein
MGRWRPGLLGCWRPFDAEIELLVIPRSVGERLLDGLFVLPREVGRFQYVLDPNPLDEEGSIGR